jgi:hypothetical protein
MRWPLRLSWLIMCMPLLAAACQLYDEQLLSSHAVDNQARDAGTSVSRAQCGDGKISGPEKCDVGIPRDAPGACPTECPALASCAPRVLKGTDCQAECQLMPVKCGTRDDCCPADCLSGSDEDCSNACGDGIIDAERGETCESNSQTPCPRSDEDCADDDPCTTDRVLGSAQNCSALCVHLQNNMRKANDGCCPPGADAMQDSDCSTRCGGGVRESSGDCDGSANCSSRCEKPAADGDADAGPPDAFCGAELALSDCQRCSCERCLETYLACRQGSNAQDNALCSAVLDCAERAHCTGDTCYCGTAPTIPPCLIPSGPCMQEIEMAAGTADADMIRTLSLDPLTPLGRATAAGMCRVSECNGDCIQVRDTRERR